jgi:hypothetical protein
MSIFFDCNFQLNLAISIGRFIIFNNATQAAFLTPFFVKGVGCSNLSVFFVKTPFNPYFISLFCELTVTTNLLRRGSQVRFLLGGQYQGTKEDFDKRGISYDQFPCGVGR